MKITHLLLSVVFILKLTLALSQNSDTVFIRYDTYNSNNAEYTTDTLIRKAPFDLQLLFETAWITNTSNQLEALSYGLYPFNVESECKIKGIESGNDELVSISQSDSMIVVEYNVATNCCFSFLCDFEVTDSVTLDLKYISYGSICGCTCYHTLKYVIKKEFYDEGEKSKFKNLRYITLNGELRRKLD